MRQLIALVAAAALLTGCAAGDGSVRSAPASDRCDGVSFADVRGPAPALAHPPLEGYPAAPAVCAAYWVPQVDRWFTPQSLEVRGTTAYVGGYRWRRALGPRPCQIAVVDTRTGRTTAFVRKFEAPVYGPEPTYCRHAGGMELTRHGLWVAEFERLWLLDPARLGRGDPVIRVWRLAAPVRAGTMLVSGNRLGLASYVPNRPGRLWWFDLDHVLAPGTTLLDRPVAVRKVPARLQGVTSGQGGGLWSSSSRTHCGALKAPGRAPVSFVPGGEDIELVGPDIWTVSEAGTRPYLDDGERVVPALLRLDRRSVLAGPRAHCAW
ncbi:hypothetical protein [Marmoricola sp. RAF53]|uniref:hypothetical protein n=1 Tax=Marmoricola sp. RAF53 TaxID=3233059 RepID=UPI003F9BBD4F